MPIISDVKVCLASEFSKLFREWYDHAVTFGIFSRTYFLLIVPQVRKSFFLKKVSSKLRYQPLHKIRYNGMQDRIF